MCACSHRQSQRRTSVNPPHEATRRFPFVENHVVIVERMILTADQRGPARRRGRGRCRNPDHFSKSGTASRSSPGFRTRRHRRHRDLAPRKCPARARRSVQPSRPEHRQLFDRRHHIDVRQRTRVNVNKPSMNRRRSRDETGRAGVHLRVRPRALKSLIVAAADLEIGLRVDPNSLGFGGIRRRG